MKTNHNYIQKQVLALLLLSTALVMPACQQEGTAEKAGKKIDQVTAEAGKELQSAKSAVSQKAETAGDYIDDSMITAKVKEALIANELLKASQIEVTTINGVVKLTGALESEQLVNSAVGLVKNLQNVKSVQNELTVSAGVAGK